MLFFFKHPEVCALFPVLMIKKIRVGANACEGTWAPWRGGRAPCSPGPGVRPSPRPRSAQTKEPAHTRGWSFSWSHDSFQFTKDSGQGSEKSGWLIRPYDFTLQRTRQKRRDTADSRGTAVGCWLSTRGCDLWDRHGTRFPPFQQIGSKNGKEEFFP